MKVLINDDLFNLDEKLAYMDEIDFDIAISDAKNAIGVISHIVDNKRYYFAYGNDEFGRMKWLEDFDTFRLALFYARIMSIDYSDDYHETNEKKLIRK